MPAVGICAWAAWYLGLTPGQGWVSELEVDLTSLAEREQCVWQSLVSENNSCQDLPRD